MVWKCRMRKTSPESIQSLFQIFPEECIKEMVERFRERQVAGASKSAPSRSYLIIRRDAFKSHKIKAVQQFLDWTKATYAERKDGAKYGDGNNTAWMVRCLCSSSYRTIEGVQNVCYR